MSRILPTHSLFIKVINMKKQNIYKGLLENKCDLSTYSEALNKDHSWSRVKKLCKRLAKRRLKIIFQKEIGKMNYER